MTTILNKVKSLNTATAETFLSWDFNTLKDKNRDVTNLKNAIVNNGFSFPVIVWQGHNYVIDGAGRKKAVQELLNEGYDIPEIPYVEIEAKDLREAKQKALEVSSQFGDITKASMLEFMGEDMEFVDWASLSLDLSFDDFIVEPEDKDDDAPDLPTEAVSKLGDMYELGPHRLLCGDSTKASDVDTLMNNNKADMVFTDPPYEIDYSGGRTQVVATKTYGKLMNDDLAGVKLGELVSLVFSYNKAEADVYICVSPIMQKPFLDFIESVGKKVDAVIVWDKKNAGLGYMAYRRQTEFILFIKGSAFKKGDKSDFDLWSISRDSGTEYKHGTQKPVAVAGRAIANSSKQDDIVLDLFCGSGSTLIACEKSKRIMYGMELDPRYVDVIVERYLSFTNSDTVIKNGEKVVWKLNR